MDLLWKIVKPTRRHFTLPKTRALKGLRTITIGIASKRMIGSRCWWYRSMGNALRQVMMHVTGHSVSRGACHVPTKSGRAKTFKRRSKLNGGRHRCQIHRSHVPVFNHYHMVCSAAGGAECTRQGRKTCFEDASSDSGKP